MSDYWYVPRVSFKFNTYAAFQQRAAEVHNRHVRSAKNEQMYLDFALLSCYKHA